MPDQRAVQRQRTSFKFAEAAIKFAVKNLHQETFFASDFISHSAMLSIARQCCDRGGRGEHGRQALLEFLA